MTRYVTYVQISGNTIFLEVIEDEYAARVTNLHMYDAVR